MIRTMLMTALLATAAVVAPQAQAAALFTATLSGDQEVPPRDTPATGTGTAVYDGTRFLDVSLSWSGLLAPAAAAHIHCCVGPEGTAPVAIDFVPAGFPNVTSGLFEHSFDLDSPTSYGGAFLAGFSGDVSAAKARVLSGMFAEQAYFNIHTSVYPPGEIRGNIAVPEPAALALLGLGVALIGGMRRRAS